MHKLNPRADYLAFGKPCFGEGEIDAVTRVLRSGWVGMGPEVEAFERELGAFIGAPYVVSLNSCTAALHLALRLSGVGPGDEVICPSFTWCSSANAALYLGAKVVFCDIDPQTFCVTPESVEKCVSRRTKAVMIVHFGGLAADVRALRKALPRQVAMVEDAAHALGACYPDGGQVGAVDGNFACFSFYANKNLSTGEGGAIAVHDEQLALSAKSLRLHALPVDAWKRFINPKSLLLSPKIEQLGYKINFTDLQASIGRVQLRRQQEFARHRREIALQYAQCIGRLPAPVRPEMQAGLDAVEHARHLFVIKLRLERMTLTRDEFVLALRARNIGASIHYAPLHDMPLYQSKARLPVTDHVARRVVTLPISASMSLDDAKYVCAAVEEVLDEAMVAR